MFSRICTTVRDAQPPWWGWDGATLFLCRVGMQNRCMASPVPRFDESLVELLSALGIPVDCHDPHREARGDDFLAVLQASAALRERDRTRSEIARRRESIRQSKNEIARFEQEIARLEEKLRGFE